MNTGRITRLWEEDTLDLPDEARLGGGPETGPVSACIAMSSSVNKPCESDDSYETFSVSAEVSRRFRMWS